jgi:hypothetical protein
MNSLDKINMEPQSGCKNTEATTQLKRHPESELREACAVYCFVFYLFFSLRSSCTLCHLAFENLLNNICDIYSYPFQLPISLGFDLMLVGISWTYIILLTLFGCKITKVELCAYLIISHSKKS